MGKLAGRLLIAAAVIHTLFGVWFGRAALVAMARDGFFNSVDPHRDRQLVFWFIFAGLALLLLGHLVCWAAAQAVRLPAFLGWELLALAVACGVLMPVSGWFLILIPAVMTLASSGRRPV
jgi:hypothetical protein